MSEHTHPTKSGHGVFNRFVADCPACDEMRARRDAAVAVLNANAAEWSARHIYGEGQPACRCYRCTGRTPR